MHEQSSQTDEQLIADFAESGNAAPLDIVLRRHERQVYGLAFRILGNAADAEDAMQEAFIKVFRKARSFRIDSAFSTWLHRVTVNVCYDLARRRARAPVPVEEVAIDYRPSTGESDVRLDVENALGRLSLEHRTALVLRHAFDLSYEEIAEVLGVPEGTVKSRIARARSALAQDLNPAELPADPERLRGNL